MQEKVNQLKLNKSEDKIKYYTAFSYLSTRPLFKAKLFEYFDYDIERAFMADKGDIEKVCEHFDISIPRDFLTKKDKLNPDECYEKAFLDKDVKILTYEDVKYPKFLKEIPDFPLSIYYKGNIDFDNDFNLAIVGSRDASSNAKLALDKIVSEFKNSNLNIISGLAYGIDAQAHSSALKYGLKTIAVVGSGLDIIYPSANRYLFYDIIEKNGAIFSEYPLNVPPLAHNFPQRNRIVVGMSKGVLVGEARLKSGAMISANLALDYNRELMCIPGNILNPNTEGIYQLIKNGAGIVCTASDLLNCTGWDIILNDSNKNLEKLNDTQSSILRSLSLEEKNFDEIMSSVSFDTASVMIALTELELKGLIKQSNNKYYKC